MSDFERSVRIGSNPGNTVPLPNNDGLAVLTLIADTLIIKILHLLHRTFLSWKLLVPLNPKKIVLLGRHRETP